MASAKEFLIKLLLKADTSQSAKVSKSFDEIANRIDKVSALGSKMSMVLTAPIVAIGGLAVRNAAQFEQSMARVAAVSGATADEMRRLTKQARDLGAATRFSASEAAQAQSFLSMAGFKPNETIAAMPSTLNLAAAAMLDMGTAADITSNILTGFGMKTEELAHVNDVLVKGFTSSNTDLRQLGEAMKYVAPVAKGAGQSIEDITASIGALGNAGIQGSMAGTVLRGAISKLLNPNREATKTLKELGVSTLDSQGKMRPLVDILGELADSGIRTDQVGGMSAATPP